ncbi:MAG: L,D-transpeptidase family protein [Oscillospiraceae bacterium]|nr:L,D-transpeptidase family protein [Oscillospiraceae bacterium]
MMRKTIAFFIAAMMLISASGALAAPDATSAPEETANITAELTGSDSEAVTASPEAEPSDTDAPGISSADVAAPNTLSPTGTVSPTPMPTQNVPEKELSKEFKLDIVVTQHKYILSNNAFIELYSEAGELLGSQHRYVGWDTPSVSMTFEVPEYRMGEKFRVKLTEGLRSISYYDQRVEPGGYLEVQTYGYLDEDGKYVQNNGATIEGNPHYDKEVRMYVTNKWLDNISPRARIVDGITMMPVRAIGEAMGLEVKYNPDNDSVACAIDGRTVRFYANNIYMETFGVGVNADHETVYIDGSMFVPVRALAKAFECTVEVSDYNEYMDVLIGESPIVHEVRNRNPVNRDGIGSKTNYLVWVSKHEYTVRVYEGQQYNWTLLKEFPCALGAWNTPTITGQFEYIERTRWDYNGYYVGPVLRFYNGYALHSTLLYYGGGEYDGRVGVNISHGCIRLHPQDINWIADTIPMHTRIYITE